MENYLSRVMENEKIHPNVRTTVCKEMSHGIEVSNLAVMIAKELGESEQFCKNIEVAGILHDVGKLRLTKLLYTEEADTLIVEQMKYVRLHSTHSYQILKEAGYSEEIIQAVYHHHENYNGTGYPDGLRGEQIPWMARIIRTCDVFSALTTNRSYRKAFEPKAAVEIMIDEVGDYDMKVFLAFQRTLHSGFQKEMKPQITSYQMEHLALFEKEALHT